MKDCILHNVQVLHGSFLVINSFTAPHKCCLFLLRFRFLLLQITLYWALFPFGATKNQNHRQKNIVGFTH